MYEFLKDHGSTLLVLLSIAISTWTNMAVLDTRITSLELKMAERKTEVVEQYREINLQMMGLEDRIRINEQEDDKRHAQLETELRLHVHEGKQRGG